MQMSIPKKPSASDFEPTLDISTRRMVVDGYRIAARIASWDDIHVGIPGSVKMPKTVNIDAAHIGVTTLDDGTDLATAVLPLHTTHAPANIDSAHASAWYEDSGKRVARVRYSTDEFGIRADGVLFPDVSDDDVIHLKAGAPSGDWRFASLLRSADDFENTPADFAGSAIVNIAGFSSTYSNFAGKPIRLAASGDGSLIFTEGGDKMADTVDDGVVPDGCDGACEPCTCGKNSDHVVDVVVDDSSDLTAGAVNPQVDVTVDPGEAGHDDYVDPSPEEMMSAMHENMAMLADRVAELEAMIASIVMS